MGRYALLLSGFLLIGLILIPLSFPINAKIDANYVGSEVCKECHEDRYKSYESSIHAKKAIPGAPINKQGCESCHGPGSQHVEKGGGKGVDIITFTGKAAEPKAKAKQCLSCHEESSAPFWSQDRHSSGGVSCDNCHSAHHPGLKLLKAQQPDLCFGCHRDIRAQTNKQSHHPVNEKLVTHQLLTCTSCHEPHGNGGFPTTPVSAFSGRTSFGTNKMLKGDVVNELCYNCHTEKRGPFAWEHAPVSENCLNCHEAHGSNHSKLLVRKLPYLCQECHDEGQHPPVPYTNLHRFLGPATGGKNKFFARSCNNCHTHIHGSNFPDAEGAAFVR